MSHPQQANGPRGPQIVARYEEFQLRCGAVVAVISDPIDERAWVQSNVTVPVRQ